MVEQYTWMAMVSKFYSIMASAGLQPEPHAETLGYDLNTVDLIFPQSYWLLATGGKTIAFTTHSPNKVEVLRPFFDVLEKYWAMPEDPTTVDMGDWDEGHDGDDDDDGYDSGHDGAGGPLMPNCEKPKPESKAEVAMLPPPVPKKEKASLMRAVPLPPKPSELPPTNTLTPEEREDMSMRVATLKYPAIGLVNVFWYIYDLWSCVCVCLYGVRVK